MSMRNWINSVHKRAVRASATVSQRVSAKHGRTLLSLIISVDFTHYKLIKLQFYVFEYINLCVEKYF